MIDIEKRVIVNNINDYQKLNTNKWTNTNNIEFYEKLTIKKLKYLAACAGLDKYHDLNLIRPYFEDAHSILELGAGYGRVIDYLINQNFQNLSAIERNKHLNSILWSRFNKKVTFYFTDIRSFNCAKKFDSILWLWSGIAEFTNSEQLAVLKLLSTLLTKKGTLIIDTISNSLALTDNYVYVHEKDYLFKIKDAILFAFNPSLLDINNYAQQSNLQCISHKEYKTPTNRKRIFFVLTPKLFNHF